MFRMISRWKLAAVLIVGVGAASAHALDKEQLHQQGFNTDKAIHALPGPSQGLIETHTPPQDITTTGKDIDYLFLYLMAATAFFGAAVAGAMLYFIMKYRYRPGQKAYYTHGTSKNNTLVTKSLDILIFVTLDVVVWVGSFKASTNVIWNYPKGDDVVQVQVMPQQWVWNFRYPGKDKAFGTDDDIVTVNELKVPMGKKVMMQLKSRDVIHGFWVPEVRRQVDALPGAITKLWFDTTRTGDFEIACAHLCGTAHYKMKAFLSVVDEKSYNDWYAERSEWAKASFDPNDKLVQWGWNWGL